MPLLRGLQLLPWPGSCTVLHFCQASVPLIGLFAVHCAVSLLLRSNLLNITLLELEVEKEVNADINSAPL